MDKKTTEVLGPVKVGLIQTDPEWQKYSFENC